MGYEICLFCSENIKIETRPFDVYYIDCPRCGKYHVTTDTYEDIRDSIAKNLKERQRANISGWLYENQGYLIRTDNINMSFFSTIEPPVFHTH
jgi:hypothetical protein